MKSSLNSNRVNALPDVYHRPQQGAGVIVEPVKRREPLPYDNVHQFPVSRENPNRNLLDQPTEVDSLTICRRFVTANNHQHRHDASALAYAKTQYLEMFEHFNLCWKCNKPIKVIKGSLARKYKDGVPVNPTEPRTADEIVGKVAMFPTDEHDVLINKVQKRSITATNANAPWQNSEHQFKTVQFRGTRKETTDTVGIVKSHFEVRQRLDGSLYYKWIDGTDRNIQLRPEQRTLRVKRRKFGKLRNVTVKRNLSVLMHVLKDGSAYRLAVCPCNTCKSLRNPHPLTYQVPHLKCECKAR